MKESEQTSFAKQYWHANLKLIALCLSIWAFVSFGCGILLVEFLNQFSLGGYPLGFWFAQQGSIFCFILLIFFYSFQIRRLEQKFGVEEE